MPADIFCSDSFIRNTLVPTVYRALQERLDNDVGVSSLTSLVNVPRFADIVGILRNCEGLLVVKMLNTISTLD